jgi:predicted component of viral defense system (DUF524 family)
MAPEPALLEVELPARLRLTLRGPALHPHLAIFEDDGSSSGYLSVATEGTRDPAVLWATQDGAVQEWSPSEPSGPPLYEETRYRIAIEDLSGSGVPRLVVRDPSVLTEVDQHQAHHLFTGTLNFRSQVGRTDLRITTPSAVMTITVEVFPTKLDYNSDYEALLQEVSSACRALGLEYLRATYIRGAGDSGRGETRLEWLILLRNEVDTLEAAMRYIAAHPQHELERHVELRHIDRIRRPDATVRRSVARGLGRGELHEVAGIGPVRPAVLSSRSEETLNTPEHRWLRLQLTVVEGLLAEILTGLTAESEASRWHGGPRATIATEQEEVAGFIRRLRLLLRLAPMVEATGDAPGGPPSLTLLSQLGYRDAYRTLMTLRLGLGLDLGEVEMSVTELHTLYETWCFLRLAQIVASLANAPREGSVIETSPSGLRVRLQAGQESRLTLDHGDRQLVLYYNPNYRGLTGDQRPDIVLEFKEEGWPRIIVVFDAKYRLRSDPSYVAALRSPGPPIDGVNALHRYRDAIVVQSADGPGRPTVKGVALFPLPNWAVDTFLEGNLYRALETLGVGALPFTPTSTDIVTAWLSSLLGLPTPELANPGPPFLAWEHVARTSQGDGAPSASP